MTMTMVLEATKMAVRSDYRLESISLGHCICVWSPCPIDSQQGMAKVAKADHVARKWKLVKVMQAFVCSYTITSFA